MGGPIRHGVELDAMGELHVVFEKLADLRSAAKTGRRSELWSWCRICAVERGRRELSEFDVRLGLVVKIAVESGVRDKAPWLSSPAIQGCGGKRTPCVVQVSREGSFRTQSHVLKIGCRQSAACGRCRGQTIGARRVLPTLTSAFDGFSRIHQPPPCAECASSLPS